MIFKLVNPRMFPDGTVVAAYVADDFIITPPAGAPDVDLSPVDSGTVTGGSVEFDLPAGDYYAHGQVGDVHRWVFVKVVPPKVDPAAPGEDGQVWSTVDGAPVWAAAPGGLPDPAEAPPGATIFLRAYQGQAFWDWLPAPPQPELSGWQPVAVGGGGTGDDAYFCVAGNVMFLALSGIGWSGDACTLDTGVTGFASSFPLFGSDGTAMTPGVGSLYPQLASNGIITLPAAGPSGTYPTGVHVVPLTPAP